MALLVYSDFNKLVFVEGIVTVWCCALAVGAAFPWLKPALYERFGRRLAADAYRVRVVTDPAADITAYLLASQGWKPKELPEIDKAALDDLVKISGSSGLMDDNPVQRCWRDAHAISSHVVMNWDVPAENFGRAEFGLPLNPAYPMF